VPTLDGVVLWCMGTTQKRVFRKLISQAAIVSALLLLAFGVVRTKELLQKSPI
jgi:hypothetical protein